MIRIDRRKVHVVGGRLLRTTYLGIDVQVNPEDLKIYPGISLLTVGRRDVTVYVFTSDEFAVQVELARVLTYLKGTSIDEPPLTDENGECSWAVVADKVAEIVLARLLTGITIKLQPSSATSAMYTISSRTVFGESQFDQSFEVSLANMNEYFVMREPCRQIPG